MKKFEKDILLATYSNVAKSNLDKYVNSSTTTFSDIFKNNLENNINIKNEIKKFQKTQNANINQEDINDFLSKENFDWLKKYLVKIRNYSSHEDKEYKQNHKNLNKYENDIRFKKLKQIMKTYLGLNIKNLPDTDLVYRFIVISMFLTRYDIKSLLKHIKEGKFKWSKDENKTLEHLFKKDGLKNKISSLRLIHITKQNKLKETSSEKKLHILHNFFHNLKTRSSNKPKLNYLSTQLLNILLKDTSYRIIFLYNKYDFDQDLILHNIKTNLKIRNYWKNNNKSKPFKFNYVALVNISREDKYWLLNNKSLKNFILNILDIDKKINNSLIEKFTNTENRYKKDSESKEWKFDSRQFKENKNYFKLNSLKSLKMLNLILLANANLKQEIKNKDKYREKMIELSKFAPSQNDFFSLKYYIDNKNLEKVKELMQKLYVDKNELFKPLINEIEKKKDNILIIINNFIYKYLFEIKNKEKLAAYKNSEWTQVINKNIKPKVKNKKFNEELNANFLIIKRERLQKKKDLIEKIDAKKDKRQLFNHLLKWRPLLLLANKVYKEKNKNLELKEFRDFNKIFKHEDFKWINSEKFESLVKQTHKLIGKIFLPKEVLKIKKSEIQSNLHIYNSKLYNNFQSLLETTKNEIKTKDLIEIVKKYQTKELEIINKTYKLESSDEKQWLRNAIFHRMSLSDGSVRKKCLENWNEFQEHIEINFSKYISKNPNFKLHK